VIHSLTYSLLAYVEAQAPELTEVVWIYDGVSLSDRVKPFGSIEQMPEENEVIAAGRFDYNEVYHFQVGLFARNATERARLSEKVKQVLRQPDIPFLDTTGPTPTSAGFFVANVDAVTPVPSGDLADETHTHHLYFDVSVSIYRENGEGLKFTQ
jgi:hypothetical protein